MNWEPILTGVWALVNSPVGVAVIAGAVLLAINRLYAAKPGWAKYEGAIVSAIRFAEKSIPDDSGNSAEQKFDAALHYVLKIYEEVNKRRADPQKVAILSEGIRLVHNKLDLKGALKK